MKASRGELCRQITIREQAMTRYGVRIKGRQMFKLAYEHHKLDEANGALFTLEDILHVELISDKLAKFKNGLDATVAGQTKALDEEEVRKPLLLRQLRRSSLLKEELMHYDRADPS